MARTGPAVSALILFLRVIRVGEEVRGLIREIEASSLLHGVDRPAEIVGHHRLGGVGHDRAGVVRLRRNDEQAEQSE